VGKDMAKALKGDNKVMQVKKTRTQQIATNRKENNLGEEEDNKII
jgi:hypothetical protein